MRNVTLLTVVLLTALPGCSVLTSATRTDDVIARYFSPPPPDLSAGTGEGSVYRLTPEREHFVRLVANLRVGDSFRDFHAAVPKPDVRIASFTDIGPALRQVVYDYGQDGLHLFVVVQYEGDTVVAIDRGDIPPVSIFP